MTHEIERDGEVVDIYDELGDATDHPVRSFDVARRRARPAPTRPITVVLQKGHCFRRRGSTGAPGEQIFNDAVVDLAAAAGFIEQAGHHAKIVLADTNPLPSGDVFIAQHYDGSIHRSASGASIGYDTEAGRIIGEAWKAAYRDLGWTRGFRPNNYTRALSRYYGYSRANRAGIPARVVLEAGFGSNPGDRAWLDSDRGRRACALAICIATTGVDPTEPAPTPTPPKEDPMSKDLFKFVQADGPVYLADFNQRTKEGIETSAARMGLAEQMGISPDVIQVHPDVVDQLRDKETPDRILTLLRRIETKLR